MPLRYSDRLRKITRGQSEREGGDGRARDVPPPEESSGWRRHAVPATVLVVALLAGLGWLLARQMRADAALQDCVMSGRKNCSPVETDSTR
jgi:hypothetical protein